MASEVKMPKAHQTSPLVAPPPPLPPLSPCVEGGFLARRSDINHDGVLSQKDLDLWSQQYKRRYCHGRGSGAADGHYRCGATGECVQLPSLESCHAPPEQNADVDDNGRVEPADITIRGVVSFGPDKFAAFAASRARPRRSAC